MKNAWHRFRTIFIIMHFPNSTYRYFEILIKVPPTSFVFNLFFDFWGEIFNLTFLGVPDILRDYFFPSCFFSTF